MKLILFINIIIFLIFVHKFSELNIFYKLKFGNNELAYHSDFINKISINFKEINLMSILIIYSYDNIYNINYIVKDFVKK